MTQTSAKKIIELIISDSTPQFMSSNKTFSRLGGYFTTTRKCRVLNWDFWHVQRLSLGIAINHEYFKKVSEGWTMGRRKGRQPLFFSYPFPSSPSRFLFFSSCQSPSNKKRPLGSTNTCSGNKHEFP